ncbi:hypothetical protein [Bosea sp. (in: a-proteobacteria)]|uniref:hypothetical protein n=1 Tax=Bosea sp. (in: a-proteobacteria) TaxID=1871050 RepID=UPI003F6EBC64
MDFGSAARATAIGPFNVPARSDAVATSGSIPVELPPAKTVQSAAAGEAVRLDLRGRSEQAARDAAAAQQRASSEQQSQRLRERDLRDLIEPRTRTLVYQKKNRETGETVSQLPDETMLKLRVFSRELAERARSAEEQHGSSIERTA